MDFKHYIEAAKVDVKRSNGLWAHINSFILHSLENGEEMGMTLDDVAELLEQAAGESYAIVSVSSLRVAAKQIRAREELVLI